MKVLVLAPHPFYQDRGTPMAVDLLVRALSDRGDVVDLLTFHEGESRAYPRVTHHRIKAPPWCRDIRPGFSARKLYCDFLLFREARRLVKQKEYDVVHAGEEAVFLAMLFKTTCALPYVYDMDSSIAQQLVEKMPLLRPLSTVFNWCEASAIRRSQAVAPVCSALREIAVGHGAHRTVTLHDISQFEIDDFTADPSLRQQLGIEGLLALYVGNLESYQGIDLLLESFKIAHDRNQKINLLIAGGIASHIARCRQKAERLGVGSVVRFIGPWPASKLGSLLATADFLVAPRIKGLNTPMKIFPYLHSGRAVLATNLPTHTQLLNDSVAMLAPARPTEFADGMVALAADEALRRRLGKAGRDFILRNHTYADHRRRVDELYDGLFADVDSKGSARQASMPLHPPLRQ